MLQQMRVCDVPHINPEQRPRDLLLSLSGLRCLRYPDGPRCDKRPVRQDLLDGIVWTEVIRLLEDPGLIEGEIDRRLEAARNSDPNHKRERELQRQLTRKRKGIDRLINAYQEELITIDDLRARIQELRRQEHALQAELQSVADQVQERENCLRLAEMLTSFLARLRESAETLDIAERQRIVRLLVKNVLVGDNEIIIRHSIPMARTPRARGQSPSGSNGPIGYAGSCLLRTGSGYTVPWCFSGSTKVSASSSG